VLMIESSCDGVDWIQFAYDRIQFDGVDWIQCAYDRIQL